MNKQTTIFVKELITKLKRIGFSVQEVSENASLNFNKSNYQPCHIILEKNGIQVLISRYKKVNKFYLFRKREDNQQIKLYSVIVFEKNFTKDIFTKENDESASGKIVQFLSKINFAKKNKFQTDTANMYNLEHILLKRFLERKNI